MTHGLARGNHWRRCTAGFAGRTPFQQTRKLARVPRRRRRAWARTCRRKNPRLLARSFIDESQESWSGLEEPASVRLPIARGMPAEQRTQIEAARSGGQTRFLSVQRIEILLDMIGYWHHQQWFAQPGRFVQRLEPGGTRYSAAFGHHPKELGTIDFMKRESGIVTPYGLDLRLFAKAMQFDAWVGGVPAQDFVFVALI